MAYLSVACVHLCYGWEKLPRHHCIVKTKIRLIYYNVSLSYCLFYEYPRFCVSYQIRVLRFPHRETLLLSSEDWHVDVIANPESHNLLPGSVLLSVLCTLLSVLYYLYSVLFYLYSVLCTLLNHALCHHGLCHFHEACHVGTLHVVYIAVGLSAVLHAVLVDVLHDPVQLVVHLFA